jgi:hypothetical protein
MVLPIELDREEDGRWIAEALELPGVMSYGATREEAISNTESWRSRSLLTGFGMGNCPPPPSLSNSLEQARNKPTA